MWLPGKNSPLAVWILWVTFHLSTPHIYIFWGKLFNPNVWTLKYFERLVWLEEVFPTFRKLQHNPRACISSGSLIGCTLQTKRKVPKGLKHLDSTGTFWCSEASKAILHSNSSLVGIWSFWVLGCFRIFFPHIGFLYICCVGCLCCSVFMHVVEVWAFPLALPKPEASTYWLHRCFPSAVVAGRRNRK